MLATLAQAQATVEREYTDVELEVRGSLPTSLNGVLYRNGGGRFERGGQRYGHVFDGDGHLCRFSFDQGRVQYRNRFVRTRAFLVEEQAGRMRWRGFGTQKPGGLPANLLRLRFKNAANTHIVAHGGRLLALWEGGAPHRIDPVTLETMGEEDFDGQLRNPLDPLSRWSAPLLPFSAHPQIDAATGELINFGLVAGHPSRLVLYRVDADGGMSKPDVHPIDRFSFVHQIAVTKRWICVLLPYADFDVPRALLGLRSPADSLKLRTEQPMEALLIPRHGGQPTRIKAVPGFILHIAEAVELDDGRLQLHLVRYPAFPNFSDLERLFIEIERNDGLPRLERLDINPATGHCTVEQCVSCGFELPTTAPGRFGEPRGPIYGIGTPEGRRLPYFSAISRFDPRSGELKQRDFGLDLPGEPIPTAESADQEEWLLSLVYRAADRRTELLVLDAHDLSTQATIPLPQAVPPGFHGSWIPAGRQQQTL